MFFFLFVAFGVVLDEVRHPATDRQNGKILLPLNVIIIHQYFSVIICHINKHAEGKGFHVQEVWVVLLVKCELCFLNKSLIIYDKILVSNKGSDLQDGNVVLEPSSMRQPSTAPESPPRPGEYFKWQNLTFIVTGDMSFY